MKGTYVFAELHFSQKPEGRYRKTLADFVQNSQIKNVVRTFASPIEGVTTSNLIVLLVITDNPFSCAEYMIAGVN
jgi:hypothetical protein